MQLSVVRNLILVGCSDDIPVGGLLVIDAVGWLMQHGVGVISPSSWEPQEEGMMSTVANFPSVRNQGLSYPGKSQTQEGDAC
jgi:hypothetical protein